ncbi:MAG: winged helix DNA-binding domain-containing protein [Actinomycetota bacterium]|nr:winged helix DNA-binding domain-containing protein [Actinomycetota bacterium]
MTPRNLSKSQARRIALAAQGFTDPRPTIPDMRALSRVLRRISLLQIDSVNVATRAHYMPLFSRLGPYDRELLHRAAGRSPRRVFEYWGHVASYVRVDLQPALRFRMQSAEGVWGGVRRLSEEQPHFIEWVKQEVVDRGPLTARDIETDLPRETGNWGWNWSQVKVALEWLFYIGQVTVARRNSQFERLYDLPERVMPAPVLATPTPSVDEAHHTLLRASAVALGVGTERCLRDYFRLSPAPTRAALADLVESGELLPVTIEGWARPAYLWHEARLPRKASATALLSPFDSLIFERERTEQLFDYRFRIEIYVPAPKRIYGYYVYSFLYDDRFAARVDVKADRQADVLRVVAAFAEPGAPPDTAERLLGELESMAGWLGLGGVAVEPRGDLAPALSAASRRR